MRERTLLVVEDDVLMRELLASALEQRGFTVDTAANAADARRAFRRADPDGVILDVELGAGPNGFDLAEALRAEAPHLPIVFLTNLPDARFAERDPDGIPTGVAYLRKSAIHDVGELVAVLDTVLRGDTARAVRHDYDPGRPLAALTAKQLSVVRLIALGMTNAQIAEEQGLSVKAIEDTARRAFAAMGLDGDGDGNVRVAAARRYLEATHGSDLRAD